MLVKKYTFVENNFMPKINSDYTPSLLFKNKHFNTVFRTFFTKQTVNYKRKRLELEDGDFIDLDFSSVNSDTIVIALHGLEGSSKSKYIIGITNYLNKQNIDVVAVNFRGCSGKPNRLLQTYHSGKTDDLHAIITYINAIFKYKQIVILGYSLGGNITLKYLGENSKNLHPKIKCAIAISVPCDLESSSKMLANTENKIYLNKFLQTLKSKTLEKLAQFPDSFLKKDAILKAKNFYDFDNLYTAPAHGFKNAEDYWRKSSSKPYLARIKTPTLMLNALDDSFLSKECYPTKIAEENDSLFLEIPKYGGHVGFNSNFLLKNNYWLEKRIVKFMELYL